MSEELKTFTQISALVGIIFTVTFALIANLVLNIPNNDTISFAACVLIAFIPEGFLFACHFVKIIRFA